MAVSCGWPDDAVRNARLIRQVVKERMPGEDLCYSERSKRQVDDMANTRRKAHNILCEIGKHLAALKDGDGRLSKESKRVYLKNLRERLVPTNDESLVRMIRNLLLDEGDDLPTISFTGTTVDKKAVDQKVASSGGPDSNAREEASDKKPTHQHSFNIHLDSSSSSSSSEDDSDEEVPIQKPIARRKPNDAAAPPTDNRGASSPSRVSEPVVPKPVPPAAAMAEPKENLLPNRDVPTAPHAVYTNDTVLVEGPSEWNAPTNQANKKAPKPVKKTLSPKKTSAHNTLRRPRSQSESSSSSSCSSSSGSSSSSSSSDDSSSSGSASDSSTSSDETQNV